MTADIHTCSYYCERPECIKRQRDELRDRMEAVLAQQPAAPSGETAGEWVLVPREPTDAMLRAAQSAWLNDTLRRTTTMWRAMLEAAPRQPAAEPHKGGQVMQDQYLKLPRLNPDALSRCERLLRDWESMAGTDNSVDGCAEELRAALYQTGAATMADIELLPLPEWVKCDDLDGLTPEEVRAEMRHYARANVARAIAAKDAEIDTLRTRLEDTVRDSTNEIEALRREVEEWRDYAEAQVELRDEAEDHAEELAKSLAELITWIPTGDVWRRLGFDPEAPMLALKRAKLALMGGRTDG